jgi:two-component system sensor histidine kinase/response regulator
VDAVATGKEAIAAIQQHDAAAPYDIVFMDWRMPGMDGLQASRHIKSDETLRHPPHIVLVTAFGREEVREEAERLKLDGFLVKPVTRSMIVDTLVNVFAEDDDDAAGDEGGNTARLGGVRVLLAEDNEINQQIAVELLQSAGAAVKVANNGREAVEILSSGPQPSFDIVLMDLQMPEMDGYQATAKLRADVRFATLPIVAMTAHATIEERQRCLAVGMNDHIAKPIDPDNLIETVSRCCKPNAKSAGSLETAKARTSDTNDAVPAIAGLNTDDGVKRVAGNRKLYLKLLRQFAEERGAAADEISRALARGDTALAERLAHALKGVAGNIGAGPLCSAAGALERVIRDHGKPVALDSAMQKLSSVLEPLMAELRTAFNSAESESGTRPPDAAPVSLLALRETAAELNRLLSDSDPAAVEFVQANRAALRGLFAEETCVKFEKLVESYAFADAEAQLAKAIKNLPPS